MSRLRARTAGLVLAVLAASGLDAAPADGPVGPFQFRGYYFRALRAELFDGDSPESALEDLVALHRILNHWDGWTWRGGIMKVPAAPLDSKTLEPKAREALVRDVIPALRDLRAIRERSLASAGPGPTSRGRKTLASMAAISGWVLDRWKGISI